MKFTKMHGCGNDYIYINGFTEKIPPEKKPELVKRISDRHFGIGGDGAIFINPSEDADFEKNPTAYRIRKGLVTSKNRMSVKLARSGGFALSLMEATLEDMKTVKKWK